MFKKPFKVKSNTRLKGSDIKKFKSELLKHFSNLSDESLSNFLPNKEVLFSVKIIAHSGEIVMLYCVQKLPIVFEIESVIYPTVYMLWHFPTLLPTFTTHPPVLSAISGGADLMLPGVVVKDDEVNIKSYGKLEKGTRVSVNLTCNKAPIAVGKTALSSFDMYMSARRGKCVNILHFYGDTLSNYGSTLPIPDLGPVTFDEPSVNMESLSDNTSNLNLNDKVPEGHIDSAGNDGEQGVVDIESPSMPDEGIVEMPESEECGTDRKSPNEDPENTEEDMDELLMYCFLKSLKSTVTKNVLPVLVSTFYKQHILANCPASKNLDIKKTKHKKLSNFLSQLEETGIIKLETVSKGVQRISFVAHDHTFLREFDEKYYAYEKLAQCSDPSTLATSNKPAAPEIVEKRTVTAAVLPLFSNYVCKKGDSLTMDTIRKYITDYVKVNNLRDDVNKKCVKPDKVLCDLIGSNRESITWDVLINCVIGKMGHSYELTAGERNMTTLVKSKLQPIDIQVSTRVYNKKITLVNNLELYGINVTEFAQECQHGVGASTTINNVPNSKSAQVQIQGNQVIFVNKLLTEKYNIQKRYIRGLEFAPKKKK